MTDFDPFAPAEEKEIDVSENKSQAPDDEIKNLRRVEAALFVAGKWLSLQELITLTDINPLSIKEYLQQLIKRYQTDNSAVEILEKENMWKMDVKPEYANVVNKLITGSSEFTNAEQETLAVIAYKQPVKQSVIIKIRGNKAYDHVKKFISLGLVKTKPFGHTMDLELSEEFYDYFGIEKDSELK